MSWSRPLAVFVTGLCVVGCARGLAGGLPADSGSHLEEQPDAALPEACEDGECSVRDAAPSGDAASPDVQPRCDDRVTNGDESDVDCGGTCASCPEGASCRTAADCSTAHCEGDRCEAAAVITFRNFDPDGYDYPHAVDFSCAGTTRFDSTGEGAFVQTAPCSNQASQRPAFTCGVEQTVPDGPPVCVLRARGLVLGAEHVLELVGDKPVIIAVRGDASVLGTISADALGVIPGAGGNQGCDASQGGDGAGSSERLAGASGGGGGGFATAGGAGGTGDSDGTGQPGGTGGATRGKADASPLLGGCPGGRAGGCTGEPGAGGGAVQLAVSGVVTVRGAIHADGGQGTTPCGPTDEGGGTGGGSGGTVLLEAARVDVSGATLRARGGAGGRNGSYAGIYTCGASAGGAGATAADTAGGDGATCQGGGSGGGGGSGRVIGD